MTTNTTQAPAMQALLAQAKGELTAAGQGQKASALISADFRSLPPGAQWPYGARPARTKEDAAAAAQGNQAAAIRYRFAGLVAKYYNIWQVLAANAAVLRDADDTIVSLHKALDAELKLPLGADGKPRPNYTQGDKAAKGANAKDAGQAMPACTASADVHAAIITAFNHGNDALEALNAAKGANSKMALQTLAHELRAALEALRPFAN